MPRNISLTAVLLMLCFAGVTGCNTIAGAGEDMQEAGEAIEEEADDNDNNNN